MSEPRPSKGEITRAGRHLAARLQAVRAGERKHVVDPDSETDLRARTLIEWWRDEHVVPMDEVRGIVARLSPLRLIEDEPMVSVTSRPKRFTTILDKLLREPVKLAEMADLGGGRSVVETQEKATSSSSNCTKRWWSGELATGCGLPPHWLPSRASARPPGRRDRFG